MASLKEAITSIITQCKNIGTVKTVAIWNNQLKLEDEGQMYDFLKPALFVEVRSQQHTPLSQNFSETDLQILLHVVYEKYNELDGTQEQNLDVYDFKAAVNFAIVNFKPTQCSQLMKTSEQQDYDHTNIYHYIIEYKCSLIDTDAINQDATTTVAPPIALETDILIETTI